MDTLQRFGLAAGIVVLAGVVSLLAVSELPDRVPGRHGERGTTS